MRSESWAIAVVRLGGLARIVEEVVEAKDEYVVELRGIGSIKRLKLRMRRRGRKEVGVGTLRSIPHVVLRVI